MKRRSVALKTNEIASRQLCRCNPPLRKPMDSGWVRNMYYTAVAMSNKFVFAGCRGFEAGSALFRSTKGEENRVDIADAADTVFTPCVLCLRSLRCLRGYYFPLSFAFSRLASLSFFVRASAFASRLYQSPKDELC